jgi:hypothetical protein
VKKLLMAAILLMMAGCGSNYTLKEGGWKIEKKGEDTCLTVHGDGDAEVVVVCIAHPAPIKLPKSVLDKACPKCAECPPAPAAKPAAAPEKTDGAE